MKLSNFRDNNLFRKIADIIRDLLFPPFGTCPSCSKILLYEQFICEKCMNEMKRPVHFCAVCSRAVSAEGVCVSCAQTPPVWDKSICSFIYHYPADNLIHEMKYRHYPDIANHLGRILGEDILRKNGAQQIDCITFVPSSPEKLAERGYNQAELLARSIGELLNIPVQELLADRGESVHQVGLGSSERAQNAYDRFLLREDVCVHGQRIIVVDDVITTGSTMSSCVRALKDGGAAYVVAASVCQTISEIKK